MDSTNLSVSRRTWSDMHLGILHAAALTRLEQLEGEIRGRQRLLSLTDWTLLKWSHRRLARLASHEGLGQRILCSPLAFTISFACRAWQLVSEPACHAWCRRTFRASAPGCKCLYTCNDQQYRPVSSKCLQSIGAEGCSQAVICQPDLGEQSSSSISADIRCQAWSHSTLPS